MKFTRIFCLVAALYIWPGVGYPGEILERTHYIHWFGEHGFPGTSLEGLWDGAPLEKWSGVLARRWGLDSRREANVVSVEQVEYASAWKLTFRASSGDHEKIRAGLTREGLLASSAYLEARWVEFEDGDFDPGTAKTTAMPSHATLMRIWREGRGKTLAAFGSAVLWETPGEQTLAIREQSLSLEHKLTPRRDGWMDLSLILKADGDIRHGEWPGVLAPGRVDWGLCVVKNGTGFPGRRLRAAL